jgi:hypothetical protein
MQFRWTPLDFISREEWVLSLLWTSFVHILDRLHLKLVSSQWDNGKPCTRFPDDKFMRVKQFWLKATAGIFVMGFMAMFISAWNFSFPTHVEKLLWRIASLYLIAYGVLGEVFMGLWDLGGFDMEQYRSALPRPLGQVNQKKKRPMLDWINHFADKVRNLSADKDPELAVPLRMWCFPTLLCALYCFARMYILVEDFIGLRSLPADAYTTVQWSQYIPHL